MTELTEKVEALERRLDKLSNVFDHIRKSLTTEHRKRRQSVRTETLGGRPEWVEEIVQHFNEISAELKSVKDKLDARSFIDSIHSPSDASVTNVAAEAEPQHEASSQGQYERLQMSLASSESRQRELVSTDASKRGERSSPPSPSGQNIVAQELTPQAHQVPVGCDVSLTQSTSTEPPNRVTQPNGALLDPQLEDVNAPTFLCKYEDICGNLNETKFQQFSSDPRVNKKGYFKLAVEGLPPLTMEEASFDQPGKDHYTNFSCQSDPRGFVKLTKVRNRDITFPSLPLPESQKGPRSQKVLREFWETTLADPPQDMLYVIGDPLFPDIELSSGEGLKRIGGHRLRGVGTKYIYLSLGVSFSIMHVEDAKFCSMNLLRSGGDKFWLVVEPAYEKDVERHMRQEFPWMANCSQAIRHLSRAITPNKLDEWKIPYSLDYCSPGELLVTLPGALHQAGNDRANYAIAINFLYGSSPTVPKGYKFCQTSCDSHAITAAHLLLREEGPLAKVQANKKRRLPRDKVTTVQPTVISSKRKALPADPQSRMPLVTPELGSLLEAVCGEKAFHHLCSLIYSWRDRTKSFFEIHNGGTNAIQLVQTIDALEKRSHLDEFLGRFVKVKLAEIIDERKDGRTRADPVAITNLINGLGWEDTRKNRTKLNNYLEEGRRWKRICGSFDGLLCLIPPNRGDRENLRISGRLYQELSGKDIELFHSLLKSNEFIQPMCRIGKTFQASIWSGMEVPEFKWEDENPKDISRLSMKELASSMDEFFVINKNEYKPEIYDWPKPDSWLWDWPQHPMWVPSSHRQCDLCEEEKCNCIVTCLPEKKPRITNEGEKGQGVRVIGSTYFKGQILEEFLGEVVPLETHHDGWAIEFIRPDLNDEPVAQIYPREKGNWVRKVNHSCDPSAEFRVMKISGWWRQMLVAIQDIPHNNEITAYCGRNFLRGQGKECLCEVCIRRSTPRRG